MKQLSKEQMAERDKLTNDLREAWTIVEARFESLCAELSALNDVIKAYNDRVREAETWRDDIVGDMESYMDERSEKWADSDSGESYTAWKEEWEGVSIMPMELMEEIDLEEPDLAEALEGLPTQPE